MPNTAIIAFNCYSMLLAYPLIIGIRKSIDKSLPFITGNPIIGDFELL